MPDLRFERTMCQERYPEHCGECHTKMRNIFSDEEIEDDEDLYWCEELWNWVCEKCCNSCYEEFRVDDHLDDCENPMWREKTKPKGDGK